ncbi:hypothetical protein OG894_41745 [Streptomyces sp. NBC_01724]|uniref:hypothetical protein n=1 Tax=unclassified Streptomyces TaxID=2593676 RepID=UPI002E2F6FE6|nr:hypothetical protein [Streptomyces sp. NBC_01724]WTE49248.1 hypothetical protein OG987_00045 [Streptomyces sp. NBC_01620]WTE56750.1 hypothetical protein OG987_42625 [Streptomyces sp. NBC_01620]
MTVVRRLVDEMVTAGGKLGQTALELAPAYLSEQEAADTVIARYADDIGRDVDTIPATRRYTLTGDRRTLEDTWIRHPRPSYVRRRRAIPLVSAASAAVSARSTVCGCWPSVIVRPTVHGPPGATGAPQASPG